VKRQQRFSVLRIAKNDKEHCNCYAYIYMKNIIKKTLQLLYRRTNVKSVQNQQYQIKLSYCHQIILESVECYIKICVYKQNFLVDRMPKEGIYRLQGRLGLRRISYLQDYNIHQIGMFLPRVVQQIGILHLITLSHSNGQSMCTHKM
jgi:hypothetical protein